MEFPTSYSSFTIPNGAGPGTSRTVLYANGDLISYEYAPGSNTGFYVALHDGGLFMGPANKNSTPEADFVTGSDMQYNPAPTGPPAGLPSATWESPQPTGDKAVRVELVPGNGTVNPLFDVAANVGDIDAEFHGNVYARNIQTGEASVTTVANQWVQMNVTFAVGFDTVPTILLTPNSMAPTAGGSTILMTAATAITTSGFTIAVLRGSAITMNIGWLAITSQQV
jgi:hypothetical protein